MQIFALCPLRDVDSFFDRDGKVYLFSGYTYWSYDIISQKLDSGYPKMTSDFWKGFGSTPDAAIRLDIERSTFFFSDGQVFMADDKGVIQSGYPKRMGFDLFKCTKQ